MGIANCYQKNNEGDVTLQLVPRNAEDVAGLTNPRFVLKTSAATIAEVLEGGEGAYKVENATVVAATTRSFVMQDASGVILVYCDKNTVPEVGSVVTVEGLVSPYSNVLQFDKPTVTVTGTGSVSEPTPTVVDASNIQTIIDAHKVVFVQISGELYKDGSYYNMKFSFETSKKGSIESPLASLNLDNYLDQMVDIKGWFIYTTGEGVRFTVVATEVSANTTSPNVKFDKDALNFDGSGAEPQKIGYTTQNVTGSVEMVLEGTDADKFEISAKDDSSVTVAVKGDNTSDAAYEASLVAKVGGKAIASVALTQAVAIPDGSKQVTFVFAEMGFENAQEVPEVSKDGIKLAFELGANTNGNTPKYYSTGNGLRTYVGNTITISGATITRAEFTFAGASYNKIEASGYVADGATGTWTGSDKSVVLNSTGTTRIQKIVVTYTE